MSNDSKVVHKDGTQKGHNDMPKIKYTVTRDGIYYFRIRIPTKLTQAGFYPGEKEKKCSLETSDPAEAAELVETQRFIYKTEFRQKMKELERRKSEPESQAPSKPTNIEARARRQKRAKDLRSLSSMSRARRDDFILRTFISLEQQAEANRRHPDDAENKEAVIDASTQLGITDGSITTYGEISWTGQLQAALEEKG